LNKIILILKLRLTFGFTSLLKLLNKCGKVIAELKELIRIVKNSRSFEIGETGDLVWLSP